MQDQIRADFRAAFKSRDRDAWVAELAASNTCVAPVYSISELVEDDHFEFRRAFNRAHNPKAGSFRQLAPPLAGMNPADEPVEVRDPAETDTLELLEEVGFAPSKLEKLRADGVIA